MTSTPPPFINYASPGAQPPPKKRSLFGWILFIGLAIILFLVLQTSRKPSQDISLTEFYNQLNNRNISVIILDGEIIRGTLIAPVTPANSSLPPVRTFRTEIPPSATGWPFIQWLLEHNYSAEIKVENNANLLVNLILPLVPWLLIFAFIWFFVFRQLRNAKALAENRPAQPVYIVQPPPEIK